MTRLGETIAAVAENNIVLFEVTSSMDPGHFPDLIATYFRDPRWCYELRYSIPTIQKTTAKAALDVGSMIIEGDAKLLGRLLLIEEGVRWDGNLGARGVVVSDPAAADGIVRAGAMDYETVQRHHNEICLLFILDSDLTFFDLYVPAPDKAGIRSRVPL